MPRVKRGVKAIFQGELWAPRKILSDCLFQDTKIFRPRNNLTKPLTDREVEILRMIKEGTSNNRIAKMLNLSTHTIKTHLYNIYKKRRKTMCDDFENDFDNDDDFMDDDQFENSLEEEMDEPFTDDADLDGEPDEGDDLTVDPFFIGGAMGFAYEEGIREGKRRKGKIRQ